MLKEIPVKLGMRQRLPLTTLIFISLLEVLAGVIRKEKKKWYKWKEVKFSIFPLDIIYIRDSKKSTIKLLGMISKLSSEAGYGTNLHK